MFFFIGWGKKSKKIADVGLMKCPNCNNVAGLELREISNRAKLYFISVAKWNKKYYLVCPICSAGIELSKEKKDKILEESIGLPDNKTSIEIYNHFIDSINNIVDKKNKSKNPFPSIIKDLKKKGYKDDDIGYVAAFLSKEIKNLE